MSQNVLEVKNLCKYFEVGKGLTLKAVDDVSFEIAPGETLGLVGESGCGKTTCGRTCIGLYNKTFGEVLYKGKNVHELKGKEKLNFRKETQMIFQDPYASLDPRMTVADIVAEGLDIHHMTSNKKERSEKNLPLPRSCRIKQRTCKPFCSRIFRWSETANRNRTSTRC